METLSRRRALLRLAATGGGVALSAMTPVLALAGDDDDDEAQERERDDRRLPRPHEADIEHIVVVMMENRSFDHLTGWLPGANGRQAGLRYTDANDVRHPTRHLAPDFQGCGFADPDHSFEGGRVEYDNGKCDGWLRAGTNDVFSIGYYTRGDLPFLGQVAPRFTTLDRYFCAILGPTFPNRIFQTSTSGAASSITCRHPRVQSPNSNVGWGTPTACAGSAYRVLSSRRGRRPGACHTEHSITPRF